MLTILTGSAIRWMERHRQRAALHRLLSYDDRALEDLGFCRTEVERALRLPFGADVLQEAQRSSRAVPSPDRTR